MSGINNVRNYMLVLVAASLLAAAPVLADETPAMESVPPDELIQTPMECLMPSPPSFMLDNAETLPDILKNGMGTMNDFVQNSAVYLNCMRNKIETNAGIVYQRLLDAARAKMNEKDGKKDPAI